MPRKKKGPRRRANNTGSIIKLKGNRRKPYCVRVTVDRDEDMNPIRKNLAYFEEEPDARAFLDMYNLMKKKKNRLTITDDQAKAIDNDLFETVKDAIEKHRDMLTFKEIFDILYEERYKYEKSGKSKLSWVKHLTPLHNKKINNISLFDLQYCFDEVKKTRGLGTLVHMKVIVTDIFEYAVIHEYIKRDQDFTSYIDVSVSVKKDNNNNSNKKKKTRIFSIEEIRKLIEYDTLAARYCLIYIFTGCRPIDLFEIDTKDIYIDVNCNDDGEDKIVSYMICSSKTDAGRNRIVPIHDIIKPFIIELLKNHPDYLILPKSKNMLDKYRYNFFDVLMNELQMNHIPYDCRHTFSTLAKLNKVDEFSRKRIMGHKSQDITDDVYTHTIINRLYEEIHKIKV